MYKLLIVLLVGCASIDKVFESKEESRCREQLDYYSEVKFDKAKLEEQYNGYMKNIHHLCYFKKFENHLTYTNMVKPTINGLMELSTRNIEKYKKELSEQEQLVSKDKELVAKEEKAIQASEKEKQLAELEGKLKAKQDEISELDNKLVKANCIVKGSNIESITKNNILFQGTATCGDKTVFGSIMVLIGWTKEHLKYNNSLVEAEQVFPFSALQYPNGDGMYSYSTKLKPEYAASNKKLNIEISKKIKEQEVMVKRKQKIEMQLNPYLKLVDTLKIDSERYAALQELLKSEGDKLTEYKNNLPRFTN
jgi:hypothetical protein